MNSIGPAIALRGVSFTPLLLAVSVANAGDFALPVDCEAAGVSCLVQQYADMDAGPAAADPFCGSKTYDGHDGTDIRVPSLADMRKGVPVTAVADGTVLRMRDGIADRFVKTDADAAAVQNRECGNGVVVSANGYEVQYCHLREGSVAVARGDRVSAGDKLGEIGASGMAQFPHLEIIFRRGGTVIEPMTGTPAGSGCAAAAPTSETLWSDDALAALETVDRTLVAAGLAGTVPQHDALAVEGPPPTARAGADEATVGWAWFVNLRKNDRIRLTLRQPGGTVFAESTSDPLDANKASYSAYVGRRQPPQSGAYSLEIAVLRGGKAVFEHEETVTVGED